MICGGNTPLGMVPVSPNTVVPARSYPGLSADMQHSADAALWLQPCRSYERRGGKAAAFGSHLLLMVVVVPVHLATSCCPSTAVLHVSSCQPLLSNHSGAACCHPGIARSPAHTSAACFHRASPAVRISQPQQLPCHCSQRDRKGLLHGLVAYPELNMTCCLDRHHRVYAPATTCAAAACRHRLRLHGCCWRDRPDSFVCCRSVSCGGRPTASECAMPWRNHWYLSRTPAAVERIPCAGSCTTRTGDFLGAGCR